MSGLGGVLTACMRAYALTEVTILTLNPHFNFRNTVDSHTHILFHAFRVEAVCDACFKKRYVLPGPATMFRFMSAEGVLATLEGQQLAWFVIVTPSIPFSHASMPVEQAGTCGLIAGPQSFVL